jgi:hypothetical protein
VQQPLHFNLLLEVTVLEPQSLQATHLSLPAKKTRERTCKISMKEEEKTRIYEIFTYMPGICSGYTRDIVVVVDTTATSGMFSAPPVSALTRG